MKTNPALSNKNQALNLFRLFHNSNVESLYDQRCSYQNCYQYSKENFIRERVENSIHTKAVPI